MRVKKGLQLPGYEVGSALYQSGGRVIYRAYRIQDNLPVAVETIDAEYPERQQVAEMYREGRMLRQLKEVTGVRQIYAVQTHGSGNLALICEYFSHTLQSHLSAKEGKILLLVEVLNIALQLAHILERLHEQDIVHKALTPDHILFDPVSGDVALAGFGIASELDQERQTVQLSRHIDGPLAYMSPEQTGRMNRELDYRSDYYSLGVLLFELMTGEKPFQADSPLGWVHSHISRLPSAPHQIVEAIPEALSDIVLKLMAKSPESRYQSAAGLIHDLKYCADRLAAGHKIERFQLGKRDMGHKFLIPQTIYGRERELATLMQLFDTAASGGTAFCLIHGYSGVGKSALVNEIDRPLVREHGFLVQGKFEQFQHGEAYKVLATALRGLVQQILALAEAELAGWREQLLEALTPNAALVVDLVPELELIIGPQPSVATLPPAEASNRLHLVLLAFVRVFAGEGHPVVLFLDDLQWSDTPTLDFLRRMMTTHELKHLLFIGAYRSNEVGPGHPLRLLLEEVQEQANIHPLPLGPLDRSSVEKLVAEGLYREPAEVRPLSNMLYDKAQGNPFFTNELLRQLHKEAAITADLNTGQWDWDLDAARWSTVSSDVVEFMVDNLRRFESDTQLILQLAACIGGRFDLHTLSLVYEHSLSDTANALQPALKQHTILPLHSDYRLVGEGDLGLDFNPTYQFHHDRVQQAAYALIDPQQRQAVHLFVGRLVLQHLGQETVPDDRLIDIVEHLNAGRALIDSIEERWLLAELNLRAGVRARQSSAYESAWHYLMVAAEQLPADSWQRTPVFMKDLALETQQCAYLTGRTEAAENGIAILLEHAESDLARADILAIRTRQYATLGRMAASIHSAIEGLALLGVDFTDQPGDADIDEERRLVEANLQGRAISDLVDAPLVQDKSALTAMRLLMEIFAAAFLSGSGKLFPYLVLKSVNLSLRHGNCPESAFIYAAYGMLLCGELNEPALGYQYGKVGLAINERLDDLTLRARVIYVYGMFVHHWSHHWSSLTPWFRRGIEAGYQTGDLLYLAYSAQDCVIWDPKLDLETAHRLHAENLEIVRECAYQDSLDSGTLFLQFQRNLLGLTDNPYSLSDASFDQEACLAGMHQRGFMTGIANYHIYSAEICFLYGETDLALEHVRAQDGLVKSAMSLPQLVRFYIVAFMTLASHYPKMAANQQRDTRERMIRDLEQMKRWADNCPDNFRHLQYLMEAELESLQSTLELALEYYEAAIDAARETGFLRDEATAHERAARYLLAHRRERAALGYLRGAYHLYDRWGAQRKVDLLEQEFPVLKALSAEVNSHAVQREPTDIDLASVMKASREISGEIVLDRLLKTTMNIVLENAGGQWGCLVVVRGGRLLVEAVALPESTLSTAGLPHQSLIPDNEGGRLALPVTLITQVLRSGESEVIHDVSQKSLFTQDPYILKFRPKSVLCVPIRRERFEGALYMENNLASGVFTQSRVEVIQLLAAQASVAIENASLYEQVQDYSRTLEHKVAERTARLEQLNQKLQGLAEHDGLTGIANRRRGDAYLAEVWTRLRREKKPLSVIMLDVDHFKAFNDNYGHRAGDNCLISVAETLRAQLQRPGDLLARYGGEEFILILPDTDSQGATLMGGKVRAAIESLAIEHAHSSTAEVVTLSAGTATVTPEAEAGLEQLLRAADTALYRAKQSGRNRVKAANDGVSEK